MAVSGQRYFFDIRMNIFNRLTEFKQQKIDVLFFFIFGLSNYFCDC